MVVAVVVLRGQVEPVSSAEPPGTSPPPAAEPGLPVREPAEPPDWRTHQVAAEHATASANREYLSELRYEPDNATEVAVYRRDDGLHLLTHRPEDGWEPLHVQLYRDALLVVETWRGDEPWTEDRPPPARLMRVELPSGTATELAVDAEVRFMRIAGDELLTARFADPERTCVVAVNLRTGAERDVHCRDGQVDDVWFEPRSGQPAWAYLDPSAPCPEWFTWSAGGAGSAGKVVEPVELVNCEPPLFRDGWAVHRGGDPAQPRLTAERRNGEAFVLDGPGDGVFCGAHLYWISSGVQVDVPGDVQLRRWHPGARYAEVVLEIDESQQYVSVPSCVDGVLSFQLTAAGPPSGASELWVLDLP